MKRIESELEKRCIKEARRQGWDCWKNEKNGNKGIPDHSMLKNGAFLIIEFKKDSKQKPSPEQIRWIERHKCVHVIHDWDSFLKLLSEFQE